ncbi:lysophospholipid acyltransferase family protein [Halalkalibacter akibai]|uniref:1-acyl-sn-glycerol-3-phosphate acyltransferase n=1 Tax=Halalkalibacter akibai (strain ATCC 43226 / DSM 21942 / CIP 109018 / JCM 9157 / 1139) TaxID=1236973 RepID=W4QSD2_HALA3|nr:lysophospholipid acyltransferase family protein [Halalkalibacter akibai]GAE34533.1 1-acyl-sn-glycerol-3-phosphate acyltransferase [Halalkalibacter akibai JCM 9157]
MGIYQFGQLASRIVISSLYKVEIIGKENIPKDGGAILCCNHIHNFDPPLLGAYIEREVNYMAKQELFEQPILKQLLPKLGAFPVKRGMSDKQALRTALKLLKEGRMLGIFPEGTRSKNGELQKGLSGAGFFALRTDAIVIPCAIIGPYKRSKPLKLVYGSPIDFSKLKEEKVSAEVATEVIMEEIRLLIEKHTTN